MIPPGTIVTITFAFSLEGPLIHVPTHASPPPPLIGASLVGSTDSGSDELTVKPGVGSFSLVTADVIESLAIIARKITGSLVWNKTKGPAPAATAHSVHLSPSPSTPLCNV